MTARGAILASPMLCLGVLAVIAADNAHHLTRQDAVPYHTSAKAAIDAFPYIIGHWTGSDIKVPDAAVKLLRPNALICRRYTSHNPGGSGPLWVDVLISQCADSRDMTGHYPPVCYPNNGEPAIGAPKPYQRPFHIKVGDGWIDGVEYQFFAQPDTGIEHKSVYDFFVVPGKGIVADIGDVRAAAGDYQRRNFGAAQFQVVMDADQPTEVRDEVFATLIGADTGVLRILESTR